MTSIKGKTRAIASRPRDVSGTEKVAATITSPEQKKHARPRTFGSVNYEMDIKRELVCRPRRVSRIPRHPRGKAN